MALAFIAAVIFALIAGVARIVWMMVANLADDWRAWERGSG